METKHRLSEVAIGRLDMQDSYTETETGIKA